MRDNRAWLITKMITAGYLTEGGISRSVQLRTCPTCKEPTLVGISSDMLGYTVAVDPYPITPIGEVGALRRDLATWSLEGRKLHHRDRWRIRGHPPSDRLRVLATHRCDCPLEPEWLAPPPAPKPPPKRLDF